MSEQKINNTFLKAHEQLDSLQKAFREGGKLEKAIAESGGDISVITAVSRALREAANSIVSATTAQTLTESVLDDKDDDGFMARSQLYFMAKDAIALHGMIDDRDDLEPWVHSKIVAASEGMDAVRRYMEYQKMSQPAAEPASDSEQELMASNTPNMDKEIAAYHKQLKLPAGGFGGKLTAESSSRMVREIEHLVKELDSDMNMNRHYGDVNTAKVVQMVQAGDIDGAADYAVGEYYDDDGGQDSSVLDGAYADMIDDLKWIVDNVNEDNAWGQGDLANDTSGTKFWRSANAGAARKRHMQGAKAKINRSQANSPQPGEFASGVPVRPRLGDLYNVKEDAMPNREFGMFTPGGDAQIENGIEHILRKFTDDAIAGTEGDRDRLRMEAHKELQEMLKDMSEEEKYEEAMDTDVRQRAAAYLEKGILRVYNMLDYSSKMKESEETLEEGMEFDEKRNGELKTVAQDVFKNALAKAKKKAKK